LLKGPIVPKIMTGRPASDEGAKKGREGVARGKKIRARAGSS